MYKITIGQLITIWVFGLFASFIFGNRGSDISSAFIFFALIFYTIGWRNYRKKTRPENENN